MPVSALKRLQVVEPVLTTIAQGFKNSKLIGEMLMRRVPVDEQSFKFIEFDKSDFKIHETAWPLRGQIRRMDFEQEVKDANTVDHALETGRDIRELERAHVALRLEASSTKKLVNSMAVKREKLISDLAIDLASYDASNRVTLSGTDQWSDYENSTPITDIDAAKDEIRKDIGMFPNTMVLGAITYRYLRRHPDLLALITPTERGVIRTEHLADIFDIEDVIVGNSVYTPDGSDLSDIWPNVAILAYVPPTAGEEADWEVPAFGYTFQLRGWPRVFTYDTDNPKTRNYQNLDSYLSKILGPDAGYLIKDAVAA